MTAPVMDEPVGEPIASRSSKRPRRQKALSTDEVVAALRRFRARKVAPVAPAAKR